ncbi:MAG: hypothetical protein JSW65_06725 [Candidatus Bipolaricaulota bacterium]|nr:MAG: hypothetical protein JSW65_06725 [Candidatus Bipolaricaulota bacterium]
MPDSEPRGTGSPRKRRDDWSTTSSSDIPRSPQSARGIILPGMILWLLGGVLWIAAGRLVFPLGPNASTWYPLLALFGLLALNTLSTLRVASTPVPKAIFGALLSISPITASIAGAASEFGLTREVIGLVSGAVAGALLALAIQVSGRYGAIFTEGRAARAARRQPNPLRASWWGMAVSVAVAGSATYLVARFADAITGPVPFTGASLVVASGLVFARFMRNIRQATTAVRNARRQTKR